MTDSSHEPDRQEGERTIEIGSGKPPSSVVVRTVADVVGQSPLEMTPITDATDPEALDVILREQTDTPVTITFQYCGCQVTVSADSVRVSQIDSAEHPK